MPNFGTGVGFFYDPANKVLEVYGVGSFNVLYALANTYADIMLNAPSKLTYEADAEAHLAAISITGTVMKFYFVPFTLTPQQFHEMFLDPLDAAISDLVRIRVDLSPKGMGRSLTSVDTKKIFGARWVKAFTTRLLPE